LYKNSPLDTGFISQRTFPLWIVVHFNAPFYSALTRQLESLHKTFGGFETTDL
jgi:hypothetical protein